MKLSVSQARKQFLSLPEKIEEEPVIVHKHNNPVMVVMSPETFRSLLAASEAWDAVVNKTHSAKHLREAARADGLQ